MRDLFRIYENFIKTYPILANSAQTATLLAGGDFLAQTFVEKKPLSKFEVERAAKFSSLGFFLVGPAMTAWYRFLSKTFGNGSKSAAIKKMACDQLIFAPTSCVIFLTCLGLLHGESVSESFAKLKLIYFDIMINNYKLWPAVQFFNFYFVPLRYQVLLVQVVALFWNTYISWKTHHHRK